MQHVKLPIEVISTYELIEDREPIEKKRGVQDLALVVFQLRKIFGVGSRQNKLIFKTKPRASV